jgi:hypothetical protein
MEAGCLPLVDAQVGENSGFYPHYFSAFFAHMGRPGAVRVVPRGFKGRAKEGTAHFEKAYPLRGGSGVTSSAGNNMNANTHAHASSPSLAWDTGAEIDFVASFEDWGDLPAWLDYQLRDMALLERKQRAMQGWWAEKKRHLASAVSAAVYGKSPFR